MKTMDARTTLRLDFRQGARGRPPGAEYPTAEVLSVPVSAPDELHNNEVISGTMILLLDQLGFAQVGHLSIVDVSDDDTGEHLWSTVNLGYRWEELLDKQQQMAPRERAGYLNVLRQTLRLRPFAVKNPRRRTAHGRY